MDGVNRAVQRGYGRAERTKTSIRDLGPSALELAGTERRVCVVCSQNVASYTCPRCNVPYCSIGCYRLHGTRCTEEFYKKHVASAMRDNTASTNERAHVLDMLQRVRIDEPMTSHVDAEGEVPSVSQESTIPTPNEIFADSDGEFQLRENLRWEDLTSEQILAFERAVRAGRLSGLIERWSPWWHRPRVEMLHADQAAEPDTSSTIEPGNGSDFLASRSAFGPVLSGAVASTVADAVPGTVEVPVQSLRFLRAHARVKADWLRCESTVTKVVMQLAHAVGGNGATG